MVLAVLLSVLIVLWFVFLWTNWDKHKFSFKFPGPWGLPFFGQMHRLYNGINKEKVMSIVSAILIDHESPFTFWFGGIFCFAITKPEDACVILNSPQCINRHKLYDVLRSFLGDGLLTLKNTAWKKHRKFLNPCFGQKILQSFISIFNQESKILCSRLDQHADLGDTFDIYYYLTACTLDMICQTTLGTQIHAQKTNYNKLQNIANKMLAIATTRVYKIWYQIKWIYKITSMSKIESDGSKYIFGFIRNILNTKKSELFNNNDEDVIKGSEGISNTTPEVFMKQLFKLEGDHFNDWDIISEAVSMVGAGYETTALTMSYCIILLAMHPEFQENVCEEVKRIFPSKDFTITFEDLNKLEYTERVLKETLRLFPSVPLIARTSTEPFEFRGTTVPIGTSPIIGIFWMHRDEKIWGPKAKQFHPDHFLPENIEKLHPYSFIPFSAGPKNCIGFRYAMNSMKINIAQIVRQFKFSTKLKLKDLKVGWAVTLKLMNKHMVSLERRNY